MYIIDKQYYSYFWIAKDSVFRICIVRNELKLVTKYLNKAKMSSDMFVFYSKSANKKPGYGKGNGWSEHVSNPSKYTKLAQHKDWRKTLSNFWQASFRLDGYTWNTVENYYHATKFRTNFPEFYKTFTLESNSAWSKDGAKSKMYGRAGRAISTNKRLKINQRIKVHPDFYDGVAWKAMTIALYAKFSQNPVLKQILLDTMDAQLYHLVTTRGQKSHLQHWDHL